MVIRKVTENDIDGFYEMLCLLDEETDFMMFEPGERQTRPGGTDRLRSNVEAANSCGDLLLAAEDGGEIVGFIWADRGKPRRVRHVAYIVVGIRRAYRRQGIGSAFFDRLDEWARENGVVRLELTVECANTGAIALYEKHGFTIEGRREKSMKVNGAFVDEYYMAKILD